MHTHTHSVVYFEASFSLIASTQYAHSLFVDCFFFARLCKGICVCLCILNQCRAERMILQPTSFLNFYTEHRVVQNTIGFQVSAHLNNSHFTLYYSMIFVFRYFLLALLFDVSMQFYEFQLVTYPSSCFVSFFFLVLKTCANTERNEMK